MADIPSINRDHPDIGGDDNSWGAILDDISETLAAKTNNAVTIATVGGTTVLSEAQELVGAITVTGILASDAVLEFSGRTGGWLVSNQTTGSFALTARIGASGATQTVARGSAQLLFGDGSAWIASAADRATTLLSGTLSSATSLPLDFTAAIAAGFRRARIWLMKCRPASNAETLGFDLSVNGGSSYLTSGIRQEMITAYGTSGYLQDSEISTTDAFAFIDDFISNVSGRESSIFLDIYFGTGFCTWSFRGSMQYSGTDGSGYAAGGGKVSQSVNAIRISFNANIATMEYFVEGYR